jgi:hypothetical protein
MYNKKEFMDKILTTKTLNGCNIIRREIGYGAEPDVYIFLQGDNGNQTCHSAFALFDHYLANPKIYKEIV